MKKLWKRIIWIAIGAVIVVLLVFAFLPKPVTADVERCVRGPLQVTLEAEGRTRVHDLFVVTAPVTGRLARVVLNEGDVVVAGATVATITPPTLDPLQRKELEGRISAAEANMRQAGSAVDRIAVSLAQARREGERAAMLEDAGSIARQDRERAEAAVTATEKELEAARYRAQAAAYEAAIARAGRGAYLGGERVVLRAPAAGRILRVLERSERLVPAGSPIMQIGDPSGLEIVIDILSSDAVNLAPGIAVQIVGAEGEKPLRARVKYVEPSAFTKVSALGIDEQRVNVIAEFVDLPRNFGDGFRVDARIVLWEGERVLKVPTSALFRSAGKWSLFVVEDGKARRVGVEIGRRNAFEAEVTSGLREGAEVIVHPSDQIADGVSIERAPADGNSAAR